MSVDKSEHRLQENPYEAVVLDRIPQLLSFVDRNPFSSTYGCGDRAFWHYRTMTDYASPIYQEMALTLAIALEHRGVDNPYFQTPQTLKLVESLLAYWLGLQQEDGSFPEFYPGERSFVATAFTSFSVSETLLRIGNQIDPILREQLINGLVRAATWLGSHRDTIVVNHTAGAIAFLNNMSILTDDTRFAFLREGKIEDLLRHQHDEGWYYEYGGADLAYLSLAVDYLSQDLRRSGDERLRVSLDRALDFMCHFIHPDGSFGGEYGTRNAKYLMPHGVELMAAEFESANLLALHSRRRLRTKTGVLPAGMDDRYTGFFLNKYASAWADATELPQIDEDRLTWAGTRFFPGAGIVLNRSACRCTIVGLSKHGVVTNWQSQDGETTRYGDTGFFAKLANGRVGVSQWHDLAAEYDVQEEEGGNVTISVRGSMTLFNTSLPLVRYLVPFRIFLKVFAPWGWFMDLFGRSVIKRMIVDKRPLPLSFVRTIAITGDEVMIRDQLYHTGSTQVVRLGKAPGATSIHVASSRYWQEQDIQADGAWEATEELLQALNTGSSLSMVTRIGSAGGGDVPLSQIEVGEEVLSS